MDRSIYDQMAAQDAVHWWYVARRDVLRALIARKITLPHDARILEIGCGSGHNLRMLAEFGKIAAVELDPASRALASRRMDIAVGDASLPELESVPAATYDLVALLDVLEHVEEDVAALRGVARCLKPKGTVLLTVPQYQWMWSGHDVANHHFRRYSRSTLRRAVEGAGLRIDLLTSFNSLLFPLAAADRIAARVGKREGSDDALPPAPVNALFRFVFGLERHLVGRVPMPPGVSLVALLSRP